MPTFVLPVQGFDQGDIDGDGDLDLMLAGQGMRWLRNDSGVYAMVQTGSFGWSKTVKLHDVDLDGDLDVCAVGDEFIDIIDNRNGGAQFALLSSRPVRGESSQLLDMDGDGDLDVLTTVGDVTPATVSWYENETGTSFGGAQALTSEPTETVYGTRTGLSDLNADGLPELVLLQRSGRIRVFEGQDPQGQLALVDTPVEVTARLRSLTDLAALDAEGDGDLDVFVASLVEGLLYFRRESPVDLLPPVQLMDGSVGVEKMAVADLNADGLADIVGLTDAGSLLRLDGMAPYTWSQPIRMGEDRRFEPKPVLIDLNDDELLEIVIARKTIHDVVAFDQTAPGQFSSVPRVVAQLNRSVRGLEVVDLDLDGFDDLVISSTGAGQGLSHVVSYGTGTGALESHPVILGTPGMAFPAHLNADGLLDLAWYDPAARVLQGAHGEPDRSFGSPFQVMTFATSVMGVQAASLDTDGRSDLLVRYANYGPGAFGRIFSRDVAGYGPIELAPGPSRGTKALVPADVGGDGDLDLFVLSSNEASLLYYKSVAFEPLGTTECSPSVPNSTGVPAVLQAVGSADVLDQSLLLQVSGLPPSTTTLFLGARSAGFVAGPGGSLGNLCLSGEIGRFTRRADLGSSSASGTAELRADLRTIPQPMGAEAVMSGETWRFQAWYLDSALGQGTSNFTDVVAVSFL
ncbi:MAG: VCBS repeat-containing protein [Planctomycetota bacterium]